MPYGIEEFESRCSGIHLSLIAEIDNQSVGFKIGYDRFKDGSFYSWMGGVLPEFRKKGVASALADFQENWAKRNGYNSIILKTRKKHRAMIAFSLNLGFTITEKIQMDSEEETRIWMEKIISH